jgi:hypothetical protein
MMIALTATVRATEPGHALATLGRSLRRFRHVRSRDGNVVVHVANIGQVLLTESVGRTRLDMVATNETTAAAMVEAIRGELALATPGRAFDQSFSLEWNRPSVVPPALR